MTIKTKSRKTASKNSPSRPVANSASARKPAAKKAARTRPADVRKPQTALAIETPAIAATASLGRDSKQSRLIASLRSKPGATIEQMMTLTGWQAHTVRGTISGVLRKRLGLNVICAASQGDGARVYRIAAPVGA